MMSMFGPEVRREVLALAELPTIPEVVARLVHTLEDPSVSLTDLSALIESDHAVTTRVLRLANSAFFGRSRSVASVRQAIVVLGFEGVRLIALATSTVDALAQMKQTALDPHEFWLHAFGSALAVRRVEQHLGVAASNGVGFAAGLLHDVGRYLLAAAYGERYARVLGDAAAQLRRVAEVELEAFGTTHAEVLAWMMTRWRFPDALGELVRALPQYATYRGAELGNVRIVAFAEQLARATGFGTTGDAPITYPDMVLGEQLGLDSPSIEGLCAEHRAARDETVAMLNQWQGT